MRYGGSDLHNGRRFLAMLLIGKDGGLKSREPSLDLNDPATALGGYQSK